ncbi:MAG TPA: sulfatase-like hydrolase/transferase [Flavobacteriaceae bacterium]|nr:sulfatase-like hydrolase/transferase [Flavobacteriaceae bacterium]
MAFEIFFANFQAYRWKNVLENCLFATAILLTVPLFNSKKTKAFLVNFYFLVFVGCLFFESVFFYLFNTIFTASAIFIIIETNASEALEFLGFYLDFPILFFFLALVIITFFYLKTPKQSFFKKRKWNIKLITIFLFVAILVGLKFTGLIVPNLPYLTAKAVSDYVAEQQKMERFHLDRHIGDFENVKNNSPAEKSTYVLIIGESTTRNHLGIYDYSRNTTPKLGEIANELLLYQKVISPHTYTIEALKKTLLLDGSSAVQLMNQAGFKTFWFSNQQPLGPFDSMVTEMAQAADVLKFTNSNRHARKTPLDGVLLPYLEKALNDPADKKFIVLHLLGTHLDYANRYPENFEFFTKTPKGKFTSETAVSAINSYDNAVRYIDWLVRETIEKTREQHVSSYVLYFSDHGEEVYQDRDFAGHTLSKATKNMFEIPFILWRSEKFKKENVFYEGNLNKPYVTNNFIFSLADLSQIDFAKMNEEKSIFSENFMPKKRIVGEGIDFDEHFKTTTRSKNP